MLQERLQPVALASMFHSVCSGLTTDFKHRRTTAFENQRLYGQIECAIGGCLQGIVRPLVITHTL
jgi:hypothetical protein